MRKALRLAASLTPLLLASCSNSSSTAYMDIMDNVDYVPVQLDKNGDWSMLGSDGELLFEDAFNSGSDLSMVIDGRFTALEKGKVSVYTADKSPKVVGDLEGLKEAGAYAGGVIPVVRPQERITLCDKSGKTVATLDPVSGKEIVAVESFAVDGLRMIRTEDDKYGYIDTSGKVVIAPTFDNADSFNAEGYAFVSKTSKDGDRQAMVIDRKGETILKLKHKQYAMSMYGKRVMVIDDESRISLVTLKGESVKLPSKYDASANWNDDYIVVHSDNGWGVVRNNDEFEVVIKPRYEESLSILPGDRFMVYKDEDTHVLDSNGERVHEFEDMRVSYIDDKWQCYVMDGKDIYFVGTDGKRIGRHDLADVNALVSVSGSWVSSDYFNVDAFVSTIADEITADAIGGFKLWSNSAEYMSGQDPENYCYRYSPNDGKSVEGYRFTVESNFVSVGTLAEWHYNDPYSYYDYSRTYRWTGSPVESVNLNATAYTGDLCKKIKPMLIKALKAKGFKLESEGDNSFEMSGDSATINVICGEEYGTTTVTVTMPGTSVPATVEVVEVEVPEIEEVS